MTDTTNQDRHRQFVNSLSKALNSAKDDLKSVRKQLWKHSSDYALLSRMADQESAAKTAAEAHGRLLPQYREALSRVAEKAQILSGECIDFAQKWGTHEAWMIPELLPYVAHPKLRVVSSGVQIAMTGPLIKVARLQRGLTLQQVADALGLHNRQQVWGWESGKVRPGTKHLAKLAEVLGLDVRDLLPRRT